MKETDRKFDLDDISIIPSIVSNINNRPECDIELKWESNLEDPSLNWFSPNLKPFIRRTLPLIASPMDTVVCRENLERYISEGIIPCMPRGTANFPDVMSINTAYFFQAFGLNEIEIQLESEDLDNNFCLGYTNILIDIANGHMRRLVDAVKKIKDKYPDITLMVGNVGHPLTYKNLALAGADYVRCSIGTGAGCTTAANVAINYPIGSLISECRKIKEESNLKAKIVADGGFRDYADIIKAIALGADYIMIGSIFNKSMESAGFNYLKTKFGRIRIKNYDLARFLWKWGFLIYKKYRGMSTKAVQRNWGKTKLVTAEGITKYQKIEYTLHQWIENFKDYLSSNMSYSGSKNLEEFIKEADWVFITDKARERFQK